MIDNGEGCQINIHNLKWYVTILATICCTRFSKIENNTEIRG